MAGIVDVVVVGGAVVAVGVDELDGVDLEFFDFVGVAPPTFVDVVMVVVDVEVVVRVVVACRCLSA
jgi:hypothetical protein